MKKILFLIVSIIISGNIGAQKLDWQERRKAADEIDVLIQKYISTCQLSLLGKSEYSTQEVEAFEVLFAEGAKITDRLGSQATEDGGTEVVEQSANEYTQALMARFPNGMTIKVAKMQADYSQLDQRKARVAIQRQFRSKDKVGKYVLDTADVMMHLTIDRDLEFVKITKFDTGPLISVAPKTSPPLALSAKAKKAAEKKAKKAKKAAEKKAKKAKKAAAKKAKKYSKKKNEKKLVTDQAQDQCANIHTEILKETGGIAKLYFSSFEAAQAALRSWESDPSLEYWGFLLFTEGGCPSIWVESKNFKNQHSFDVEGVTVKIIFIK